MEKKRSLDLTFKKIHTLSRPGQALLMFQYSFQTGFAHVSILFPDRVCSYMNTLSRPRQALLMFQHSFQTGFAHVSTLFPDPDRLCSCFNTLSWPRQALLMFQYSLQTGFAHVSILFPDPDKLCSPPWSWLLAPGVFKPSCSTPFTLFLRLVSVYRPFQLHFIKKLSPSYLHF